MRFRPRRSSPRLRSFDYRGNYAYHLVLATRNGLLRFRERRLVAFCLECLRASAARYGFQIVAYCFMPNHLHLLITGSDSAPLIRFAQHFKQATGYRNPGLWRRSYYDHVLRHEDALEDVARYIWGNPVRAAIVPNMMDYPHSGPREAMVPHGDAGSHAEDRASALSLRGES